MKKALPALVVLVFSLFQGARCAEVGFEEDFALSPNRDETLKQLIPGTEAFYYYHCLNEQNNGHFDKVEELLKQWIQRHGQTARVEEMRNRQALLSYEKDPKKSLEFVRWRLNLNFDHQRHIPGQNPNQPEKLDPKSITAETLTKLALSQHGDLNGFENSALDLLMTLPEFTGPNANGDRRRQLLQRLERPDYANLVAVILADLKFQYSGGFGSLNIHKLLTLAQLEELAKLSPNLASNMNYVLAVLTRLEPSPDVDWKHDVKEEEAYLTRVWAYVSKLSSAFNSLKANVLYHRLEFDLKQNVYDKDRFMEYLKLPRNIHYMRQEYLQRNDLKNVHAELSEQYNSGVLIAIRTDEELVREYLMHFFITEDTYEPYAEFLNDRWLKDVFAETKILYGIGDQEKWYSLLDNPTKYQQLKDRVDIRFARTNKTYFAAGDDVSLAVDIKNVKTLMMKVYEINTENYYRELQRDIDTAINLDGLIANQESTFTYDEAPLRQVRRTFQLPTLKNPGVYVVDFIGNGRSSRAVIRKGNLRTIDLPTSAGHQFMVFDENNNKLKEATLWLAGHEYHSDAKGTILVPYSNAAGQQNIVVSSGGLVSLDHFDHKAETYRLAAGIFVEREELLKRKTARIIVRPAMYINGSAMSFAALEEVTLTLQSTDRDGISSSKEVRDFKLFEDRESVYEFQVPDKLNILQVTLSAKIPVLSTGEKTNLSDSATFTLNNIDKTEHFADVLLSRLDSGYVLNVLGKTGEPLPTRVVSVSLKHRDFKDVVTASLQSNAVGRIELGPLEGITTISTPGLDGARRSWDLTLAAHSLPSVFHVKAGETLRIPYMGSRNTATREEFALFENRGAGFLDDRFEALTLKDGFLEIAKLTPGDYSLFLKSEGRLAKIEVAGGPYLDTFVTSETRLLEISNPDPLQIVSTEISPDAVKITLTNTNKQTRLHVAATRFYQAYPFLEHLGKIDLEEPLTVSVSKADSQFVIGRDIGDEYRYILERKAAPKFPGNMLDRPGLLLNPWAIRKTETGVELAQAGGDFDARSGGGRKSIVQRHGGSKSIVVTGGDIADLDFLPSQAVVLTNLKPVNDVITIARKDLGAGQQLHILAVDPENTVYRQVVLPETKFQPIDLRLAASLDAQKHFTERKRVSVIEGGQTFKIADISTSTVEPYDSISKVYGLFSTLSHDGKLDEFNFVTRWPSLPPAEKRELYSKHASHELSFFVFKKDPDFFTKVVQPHLKNKKDKTFVDHFLLEDDLSEYLKPWAYEQLNVVERILLIQRIRAEAEAGVRHVNDIYDLLPTDLEHENSLFLTSISGSALETGDDFGFKGAKLQLEGKPKQLEMKAALKKAEAENLGNAFNAPAAPAAAPPMEAAAAADRQKDQVLALDDQVQLVEKSKELSDEFAAKSDSKSKRADGAAAGGGGRSAGANRNGVMRKRLEAGEEQLARRQARQMYRKLDKTEEWVENNYHHLPIEVQNYSLVTVNGFWKDYAAFLASRKNTGFYSEHLADASRNFTEIMFALSVLDLPFDAQKHTTTFDAGAMTLSAKSPIILFHKEILQGEAGGKSSILVSENFFRTDDRYRFEKNERYEKYIDGEFLTHSVHGCQVILTNPTANPQKLELLLQIPAGAMPVSNGFYTKSIFINLAPYSTNSTEYFFYFPIAGTYTHYPVQVAKDEKIIAFAAPETLNVVDKLTKADVASWDYISQNGTDAEVITFLKNNNIDRLKLDQIAWRIKDAAFFDTLVTLLAQRHVYDNTIWSYAVKHGRAAVVREYLQHQEGFLNQSGPILESPLLSIDPVIRKSYQHMEYSPLVNARAHRLGKSRQIVNGRFYDQYERLLHVLAYRPKLDATDFMAATYYLLLQDRVEEGLASLAKVDPNALATHMQYDYFVCYAAFYQGDAVKAREIATRYTDYPVDRWRNEFAAVRAQCDEIDGKDHTVVNKDDKHQQQADLAATEPRFDFTVESRKLAITFQNLSEVRVNYYLMDIELLFSGNPFVQEYAGQFSYIRPNKTEVLKLPAGAATFSADIPQEYHSSNVMVEILGAGTHKSRAYYANTIDVQVVENYGQVRVLNQDTHKPETKAYVKVYARTDSGISFFKDGYTDLRGKFDYASLSTNELDNVRKFAILIMSDKSGALVREVLPPKQ